MMTLTMMMITIGMTMIIINDSIILHPLMSLFISYVDILSYLLPVR